jgi:P pilus assembly chaperone PapD
VLCDLNRFMKLKYLIPDFGRCLTGCLLFIAACSSTPATAAEFAATVSPPRFELDASSGETLRETVTIENAGDTPATFEIRSADWDLAENGGVTIFPPEPQPDSCRSWVRLERHTLKLRPGGTKRYRFEIHLPEDAGRGECRFALLIEQPDAQPVMAHARNIQFPVQGRLAIIVYVRVDNAMPELSLETLKLETVNGLLTPVVQLNNQGNAHGRPEGFLQGTDASGNKIEFTVAQAPILPGQTRTIPLWQAPAEGEKPVKFIPPIKINGLIEWEGGEQSVDTVLD